MWSRRSLSTYRAQTRPSPFPLFLPRGQHKFHRWNFRTSPFIWFSRKKWSARLTRAFILLLPPPPLLTLLRNWSNRFQIPNSRSFSCRIRIESRKRLKKFLYPTWIKKNRTVEAKAWFAGTKIQIRGYESGREREEREEEVDDKVENLMDFAKAGCD